MKTPLMVGDNLSPFWLMMKNVFHFTFEKQNTSFENVYNSLKDNPHIRLAPFIIADERAMIYEFVNGDCQTEDEFPKGKENAYILGQYIGYNHRIIHKNCGIQGIEDVTDFFSNALSHMEECINAHWNSFKEGYEIYQSIPAFEKVSDFFFFLMALNSYWNKSEIEMYWSILFAAPF